MVSRAGADLRLVDGVTKPRTTTTGKISGLGTDFGEKHRALLAPQYVEHLARIHTTDISGRTFDNLDVPQTGTTQAAEWMVNHALRTWEEDRGEDSPLMEVAATWLCWTRILGRSTAGWTGSGG